MRGFDGTPGQVLALNNGGADNNFAVGQRHAHPVLGGRELIAHFLLDFTFQVLADFAIAFDRIVTGAIKQLSDYIGHRPVAALESQRAPVEVLVSDSIERPTED